MKDVLAHLAASEVAAAALVAGEEATELEEYRKTLDGAEFTIDGWHRWSITKRHDAGPVSLGAEWGRAADLLLVRAGQVPDPDWHESEVAWPAGEVRLKYFVQMRVAEWWIHGEDIREGARLNPRREHWPVYAINDLAVRLIPYSLSRAGVETDGGSVMIELDGVGEGRWHQSTSAGELPPDAKPDAYINGEGYAFASVASGRADADFCLYEGILNIGGDADLAATVLRTLRSAP